MRIRRIPAEQAHAVPKRAYMPQSPWERDLTIPTPVSVPEGGPDDGGNYNHVGATAQTGMKEVKWYRCTYCGELVRDTHLDSHKCKA